MSEIFETPAILITGATGNIGSELIKQLSARKIPFRAMVRSQKDAEAFSNIENAETVTADFNDANIVAAALKGIERTFLLTNSSEQAEAQQKTFVEEAKRAGIKHIVKLSQWAADKNSSVRFLRYHAAVERKIKDSGIAYTFLRPNLFMQGLLGFKDTIISQNKFFAAIGDAKISAVDVRDIAAVAAAALTETGHAGKIYNLTGPEALTHKEMAEKLSAALNRKIEFVNVSPQAMREALKAAGFPEWQLEGLIEDYAHYARGEAAEITSGVLDASGKPPRTFADFVNDYASAFSDPI